MNCFIADHPKRRKTALGPMLILAAIAYAAAGVTFVVLAVQASQNTTVETVIQDHDISGTVRFNITPAAISASIIIFHYDRIGRIYLSNDFSGLFNYGWHCHQ